MDNEGMSYSRDHRVLGSYKREARLERMVIDEKRMLATLTYPNPDNDDDEPETITGTVPVKYGVCGTCNGKGSHVNPSIDSHGLSREDFDEDPEFKEEYFAGRYDVPCNECDGKRVTPVLDPRTPEQHAVYDAFMKDMNEALDYANQRLREDAMGY